MGEKPKIKKDVIIQNIEDGSLKVPHFGDIVRTCKITWIKRISTANNAKWKTIYENLIAPMSIVRLTETFLDDDLIRAIRFPFYGQIYTFWNELKVKPKILNNYQEQILWNNKYIVIPNSNIVKRKKPAKKSIFWKQFYKAGVIKVRDLLDGDGDVLSHHQFCLRYNINCNVLQFYRLVKAIPKMWLRCIKENKSQETKNTCIERFESYVDITQLASRDIYPIFVKYKLVKPTANTRWTESFDIEDENWKYI